MSLTDHQFICTRPFEWFEVHPDGSVFLCCPAWLKRPIGNLLTQPVEQIWNGPVPREIRKSILNGSFHNCSSKRCPHLADRTSPVKKASEIADSQIRQVIENASTHLPYPPKKLNLCFDHSCNLACPSCRPQRQWAQGEDRGRAERISSLVQEHLLPQAHEVTLSGFGDPFASPTYFSLLQRLNGNPGRLPKLRLHSNGQLWSKDLWDSLPNLHQRVIGAEISIDAATPETYAINRPGGSFAQLLKNLEFLSREPFELTLSMVVQQNNFREIPRLIELATRFNARVYLSQLVNWGTFSRREYDRRAVHLPGHAEYEKLKSLLTQISPQEAVNFGNLYCLLK